MAYALPASTGASFDLAEPAGLPVAAAVDFGIDGGIVWPYYPGLTHRVGLPWGTAAARARALALRHAAARPLATARTAAWSEGRAVQAGAVLPWGQAPVREALPVALWWGRPGAHERAGALPWGTPPARQRVARAPWDASARPRQPRLLLPFGDPPSRELAALLAFRSTRAIPTPGAGAGAGQYWPPAGTAAGFALELTESYRTPAPPVVFNLARPSWITVVIEPLPRDRSGTAPWGRAAWRNLWRRLPWGWGHSQYRKDTTIRARYPDTDDPLLDLGDGPGAEPAPKDTYLLMNLVNVVRLPDETPLQVRDLTISLDVDSWAWAFSGTVIGAASLAAVAPTAQGLTDIRVTLNGHQWVFMVERYSGTRGFNDERYTLHGASRTQYLAAPYAPRRSRRNAAQLNAVQAAAEELTYTGFLLDWNTLPGTPAAGDNTPDWTYPPGTFSYQDKTPVEVLQQIAASAGAVLIPLKAADRWRLQPRFRASPWLLAGAYADAILHWSQVTRQALEWRPAPLYNAAYVSGTHHGHGVSASRYGSAGDQPAPDLFEDGIVAVDQARERARQLIAASGNHAIIDLECAIPEASAAPGLIEPGDVLQYQGPADSWRGYVLGVTISAPGSGAISLKQTARVIRFYEH